MHRIPVRQIMRSPVITIGPDALAVDAAELMEEHDIRRLPVVDEDGYLVGIVTDTDALEAETAESMFSNLEPGVEEEWLDVSDIMSREVITIGPDADVGQLVMLMMKHKVGGIPVVEPDPQMPTRSELLGIVTETDIFQMIITAWQEEEEQQST